MFYHTDLQIESSFLKTLEELFDVDTPVKMEVQLKFHALKYLTFFFVGVQHMGLSRQAQEAVQKGRVDAITSQMSGDVIAQMNKKVEKGLNEPLLGSSLDSKLDLQ